MGQGTGRRPWVPRRRAGRQGLPRAGALPAPVGAQAVHAARPLPLARPHAEAVQGMHANLDGPAGQTPRAASLPEAEDDSSGGSSSDSELGDEDAGSNTRSRAGRGQGIVRLHFHLGVRNLVGPLGGRCSLGGDRTTGPEWRDSHCEVARAGSAEQVCWQPSCLSSAFP